MIESVRLRDFKSHEDTVVRFRAGANALLGQNGAGKTSVLQAIGYCLFDAGPKRGTEWHRKGTKSGRATVTFLALDGTRHAVERRLGGSSGIKLLAGDGTLLATQKDEVYKQVRGLLGLEPTEDLAKLWNELVGVPQGQLTSAFGATATPRRAIFDAVLRVEEYKTAADGLKPAHDHAKHKVAEAETHCTILTERLRDADARATLAEKLAKQMATHTQTVHQAQNALAQAETQLETIRAKQTTAEALRTQAHQAETALLHARTAHDAAKKAHNESHAAAQWLQDHAERAAALAAAATLLDQQSEAIRDARDALDEATRLQAQLPERTKRVHDARATISDLQSQLQDAPDFDALRKQETDASARLQDADTALAAATEALQATQRDLDQARRNEPERTKLEAQATAMAGLQASTDAEQALRAAEADLDGTRRLAAALDQQFQMLAEDRVCPILDVTCPVADEHVGDKREARRDELVAKQRTLEHGLEQLQSAAAAEKRTNEELAAWSHQEPRLLHLRQQHEAAQTLARETLPSLRAEHEKTGAQRDAVAKLHRELRDKLATEATIQKLQQTLNAQQRTLHAEEELLHAARARLDELDKNTPRYAALHQRAKDAEALLRLESGFAQELAIQRRQANELEERARTHTRAKAALHEAEAIHQQHHEAARSAWTDADKQALRDAETQDRNARATHVRLATEAKALAVDVERANAAVAQDQATARELAEAEQRLAKTRRVERTAHRVRGLIKDLGPHVAERFTEHVSIAADDWFRELTGGRPVRLQWDRDYDVLVTDQDGHMRTFGDLSGGEQVMAALAVRLSLLRSLSPVSFSVYDEPTANLDDEVRHNVARVLESAGTNQLIVVSHDDAFSESIHNAVRLEKQGTRSVVAEETHA